MDFGSSVNLSAPVVENDGQQQHQQHCAVEARVQRDEPRAHACPALARHLLRIPVELGQQQRWMNQ
jgi:hypothetical protein